MPILDIGHGDPWDFFNVFAVMHHPDDERKRQEFIAAAAGKVAMAASSDDVSLPKGIFEISLNAPSWDDILKGESTNAKKGRVAGDILELIAAMHMTGQPEPSVNKAIFLHQKRTENPASEPTIRKNWEAFKSVAHLWAAVEACDYSDALPSLGETLAGDDLPYFLAVAEWFRFFGENTRPSRNKQTKSFLDGGVTWKVPDNYLRPSLSLKMESLPDWMKSSLEKDFSKRHY